MRWFKDNSLVATDYNNIKGNTPVIDIRELQSKIYVNLIDKVRGFHPYQITEIEPDQTKKEHPYVINIGKDCSVSQNGSWIDIQTSALDLENGLHIYKIDFVNTDNVDTISLYFGYHIQNQNVPKPYIYIKREDADNGNTVFWEGM